MLLVVGIAMTGCARKKKTATVKGRVSYRGAPVTGGTMNFYPADGGNNVLTTIRPDGSYLLADAPVGELKVTVETESVKGFRGGTPYQMPQDLKPPPGQAPRIPEFDPGKVPIYVKVPEKFADPSTSGLTITVKAGKPQVRDIDLD
jgi:hypothetical protein